MQKNDMYYSQKVRDIQLLQIDLLSGEAQHPTLLKGLPSGH